MTNPDLSWGALCAMFTGTQNYYRINNRILLTEGLYFLVKNCRLYWVAIALSSFLDRSNTSEKFLLIEIVSMEKMVEVFFKDGNKLVLNRLIVGHQIFWAHNINLYVCKWGPDWVMMMPSEY